MQMQRLMILGVALSTGLLAHGAAVAQDNRGTMEQQMACTPDVMRLCGAQIPDVDRIVACLRYYTPQLSPQCRAVFEAGDSTPPQQQAQPTRHGDRRRGSAAD